MAANILLSMHSFACGKQRKYASNKQENKTKHVLKLYVLGDVSSHVA